jgi:hypothetical protein
MIPLIVGGVTRRSSFNFQGNEIGYFDQFLVHDPGSSIFQIFSNPMLIEFQENEMISLSIKFLDEAKQEGFTKIGKYFSFDLVF